MQPPNYSLRLTGLAGGRARALPPEWGEKGDAKPLDNRRLNVWKHAPNALDGLEVGSSKGPVRRFHRGGEASAFAVAFFVVAAQSLTCRKNKKGHSTPNAPDALGVRFTLRAGAQPAKPSPHG